jgi:hypothetical protein
MKSSTELARNWALEEAAKLCDSLESQDRCCIDKSHDGRW